MASFIFGWLSSFPHRIRLSWITHEIKHFASNYEDILRSNHFLYEGGQAAHLSRRLHRHLIPEKYKLTKWATIGASDQLGKIWMSTETFTTVLYPSYRERTWFYTNNSVLDLVPTLYSILQKSSQLMDLLPCLQYISLSLSAQKQ